jgi:hypothetical protein
MTDIPPTFSQFTETVKAIYEKRVIEQLRQESALYKMLEANMTEAEKARQAKAAEEAKKWCHSYREYGDDDFSCGLKRDHEGDHLFEHKHDGLVVRATWPNVAP